MISYLLVPFPIIQYGIAVARESGDNVARLDHIRGGNESKCAPVSVRIMICHLWEPILIDDVVEPPDPKKINPFGLRIWVLCPINYVNVVYSQDSHIPEVSFVGEVVGGRHNTITARSQIDSVLVAAYIVCGVVDSYAGVLMECFVLDM